MGDLPFAQAAISLAQAAFVFAASPLLIGVIRKCKARMQGRRGGPLTQPYYDVAKLFMKSEVRSASTSWIFGAAPILSFASVAAAAFVLPMFAQALVPSDLLVFFSLFLIGRFFTVLAGLDAASAFGGIGSSRELLFSAVIEPAVIGLVLFFATFSGGASLATISSQSALAWPSLLISPASLLAAGALFIVILAENGRLPFDNPATHLELTMVHEAMILEYSGPSLALIEWANASRLLLFLGLFANMFLPLAALAQPFGPIAAAGAFLAVLVLLGIAIGVVESITPKLRLFKISELLTFALLCALIALLFRLTGGSGAYAGIGGQLTLLLAFVMLVTSFLFIFSATFMRRLWLYLVQSAALAVMLAIAALADGGTDAYLRLGSTILLKGIIVPFALLNVFHTLLKGSRRRLKVDPLYMAASVGTSGALIRAGGLVLFAFAISSLFMNSSPLLPVALSLVFVSALMLALKSHVLLQLMSFLMLENGIVLILMALSVNVPLVSEATTLLDTLVLIVAALVLTLKINVVAESLDSERLNQLAEGK